MSRDELEIQFKREEFIFMQKSSIEKAKREGMKQGLEQGLEKGVEKGREERNIEIATNLKSAGVDSQTIASVTGLSIEDIDGI